MKFPPGQYRVIASWPRGSDKAALAAEDEVRVEGGKTCHVHVCASHLPTEVWKFPGSALEKRRLVRIGLAVASVALIGVLASMMFWSGSSQRAKPKPVSKANPAVYDNSLPEAPRQAKHELTVPVMPMITMPEGEARLGYQDPTVSMKLIGKYTLLRGPAVTELLTTTPHSPAGKVLHREDRGYQRAI